jgi:hypothetical protein
MAAGQSAVFQGARDDRIQLTDWPAEFVYRQPPKLVMPKRNPNPWETI